MKKYLFPLLCMAATITCAVCDFVNAVNDEKLEDKISKEVAKQLEKDSE